MEHLEIVNGKDYVITLSKEEIDCGYKYCNEIFRKLRNRYPESNFIGFYGDMTIQELTLEEIKQLMKTLNEIKKKKEKEVKKEEQ